MRKISIPFKIKEIDNDGYHLFIKVIVNGVNSLMLIDTGASKSAFDIDFFRINFPQLIPKEQERYSVGLGTNNMTCQTVKLDSLLIGKHSMLNIEVTLLDLSHVNISYEKIELNKIAGVLGSDILYKYNAQINYKTSKLSLEI